jgi:mRNA-degrading endonuclease toxin of MazEF toxin-antitoxin module
MERDSYPFTRGTICYTTLVGGTDHDQGTRPVLVLGRDPYAQLTGEVIVLPVTSVNPGVQYPLAWSVPEGLLPVPSWVAIGRPRVQRVARLRDPVGRLNREELDEIALGLRQLIDDQGS